MNKKLTAEDVIKLCKGIPVTKPQIDGYAIFPIKLGMRLHVVFDETFEAYVVLTDNEKKLFANSDYIGGAMVQHVFDHYELIQFYFRGGAFVISDGNGNHPVTPVGNYTANIIWDYGKNKKLLRAELEEHFRNLFQHDPKQFEKLWEKTAAMDNTIKLNAGGNGLTY